jgi:hypothetical protein
MSITTVLTWTLSLIPSFNLIVLITAILSTILGEFFSVFLDIYPFPYFNLTPRTNDVQNIEEKNE